MDFQAGRVSRRRNLGWWREEEQRKRDTRETPGTNQSDSEEAEKQAIQKKKVKSPEVKCR